ncbi:MAG: type II toxin-antitoxin system RelE/ParE family toxin [Legionellales bacterium]|nr:type II toxin-antitoxin system RelE/ParE family toxin [Legionellales bacterium]
MIISFGDKTAEDLFNGKNSRYARKLPINFHNRSRRLLDQLNAATKLETLRMPPSNKLSKLSGNLKEYGRLKIDKQWAIIFIWKNGEVSKVSIIDYH